MMGIEAKQSVSEAQAAKDQVNSLHQTVDRLELELQVCCYCVFFFVFLCY